jgi:hypothetical protein
MVGLLLSDGYIALEAKKVILYIIFYLIIVLGILCLEKDLGIVNQYLVWKYTLDLSFV